jgi:hypothetical protein
LRTNTVKTLLRAIFGLALAALLLLPNTGGAMSMRYAVMSGVFDFVSGTVTETLVALLLISTALAPG